MLLTETTLNFLNDLAANNNREWFAENKKRYEQANKEFLAFVERLICDVANFDPFRAGGLEAKNCVFRIYRDVRFSKNKDPYKTHFGCYIAPGGRKDMRPGYYIHISPGEGSFIAGGAYCPESSVLKAIRQEIDFNLENFLAVVENPGFIKDFKKLDGEKLSRPPQGYEAGHPAIEFLKLKSFIATMPVSGKDFTTASGYKKVIRALEQMKPLNDFLQPAFEDSGF